MNTEIKLLHPPLTGPFPPDRAADPTFDLVVRELGRARERVEIFMYVWRSDETGTRIGEAGIRLATCCFLTAHLIEGHRRQVPEVRASGCSAKST